MLSLQNRSNTDPSLERPPNKTLCPRPNTHSLRAGPGRRNRIVSKCFCKTRYIPDRQVGTNPTRMFSKTAKVAAGLEKDTNFANGSVYDFANHIGSQTKSILGHLFRTRSYFVLWTNRNCFSKLAKAKQLCLTNAFPLQ